MSEANDFVKQNLEPLRSNHRTCNAVETENVRVLRGMERTFHVYFMASESGVLYLGVTGQIVKRVWTHKQKLTPGFTQRYNVTKLVWYEAHSTARGAIVREKEVKKWRREKKVALIESVNPEWKDLANTL